VRTERVRGRVRVDGRRETACPGRGGGGGGAAEHVPHRVLAHVRQVDDHADAVHFVDQLPASFTHAAVERLGCNGVPVGVLDDGGVGVDVVAVVGEGCVADAERVVVAEVGDGVADLVEALDCEGGDELAGFEVGDGGFAVWGWGEVGWV